MDTSCAVVLRPAHVGDVEALVELCAAHAAYERQTFETLGAVARLRASLFGPDARLACHVAERDGQLLGYATHSAEASTWSGRPFTHMDCLFVRDGERGHRIGERLLRAVAAAALGRGHADVQWQTPDWNADAARFYERIGARSLTKRRFTVDAAGLADPERTPFVSEDASDSPPIEHFELRPATCVGVRRADGWALKVHTLAAAPEGVAQDIIDTACDVAFSALPRPAVTSDRYGVGFIVLHVGLEGVWLLVDWWCIGDILRQRLFWAPIESPHQFNDVTGTELHACVHEMKAIEFETRAWVETALERAGDRDVEAYLARTS